jgi:hypothetical protein
MRLSDSLFALPEVQIFRIDDTDFDSDDFLAWSLTPLVGKTLCEEHSDIDGVLDGYFVLKAVWLKPNGETESCYINITTPERIADWAFFLVDPTVVRTPIHQVEGEIVSAVAIECTGDYELFYSRTRPQIGIEILREGLKEAKNRAPIAEDLAYILRDENRHAESIAAFSIVIEEGNPNEYTFAERAALHQAVGNLGQADLDAEKSRKLNSEERRNFPHTI